MHAKRTRVDEISVNNRTRIWQLVLLALWVALSGCGNLQERKQTKSFQDNVDDYGRLLRWREFDDAALSLKTRDGEPIQVETGHLNDIRITTYQIVRSDLDLEDNEAIVRVKIDYYFDSQNVVKTLTDVQHWWYNPEVERWYLDGSLPAFK